MDVKDGTVENQGVVKVMLSRSKIPLNLPLQRATLPKPLFLFPFSKGNDPRKKWNVRCSGVLAVNVVDYLSAANSPLWKREVRGDFRGPAD
jgi:hypothetical protein